MKSINALLNVEILSMTCKSLCRNSSKSQQELLLELTWAIWPELPAYGRKAAQFVDLLGYFSLKTPQTEKKVRFEALTKYNVFSASKRTLFGYALCIFIKNITTSNKETFHEL